MIITSSISINLIQILPTTVHIVSLIDFSSAFTWGTDTGSNPILFFLHGAGECGLTWLALCEEMANKSNSYLIAYDLRGHGEDIQSTLYHVYVSTV